MDALLSPKLSLIVIANNSERRENSVQIAEEILRIKPINEGRDILFWKAAKSGKFTVKSAYWRNDKVFRDVKVELTTVFQDCKRRTEDFLSNRVWCEEEVELQTPVKSDNTKNLEGSWECYVDASVVESYAGYAIVYKQEEPPCDYWIATEVSKVESVFEGELCGIKLALQSALDQKANSIHIKTDSKNAATAFEIGSIPLDGIVTLCLNNVELYVNFLLMLLSLLFLVLRMAWLMNSPVGLEFQIVTVRAFYVKPITPCKELGNDWRVADFIVDGRWNDSFVIQIFWEVDCGHILNILLSFRSIEDQVLWHFTPSGLYSVSSRKSLDQLEWEISL
uniref:RNase H type-1 domain-containing protein n=1 Tax=Cannabis sativa TaxID=3483 RepID=A0A803QFE2_CANSA